MKLNLRFQCLIFFVTVILSACGGGTRGTGLGDSADISTTAKAGVTITGQIIDVGAGITVNSLSSGEQSETDASGAFELFALSDDSEGNLILEIESSTVTYKLDLGIIQPGQYTLQIDLTRLEGILISENETNTDEFYITILG